MTHFVAVTVIPKKTTENPDATQFIAYVNPYNVASFNRSVTGEPRTVMFMTDGRVMDVVENVTELLALMQPEKTKKCKNC